MTTNIHVGNAGGFIGGGQVGYRYQFGNNIAGIETDIQGLSGRGSGATANTLPYPGAAGLTINTALSASHSVTWLGTLRGQAGFIVNPSLPSTALVAWPAAK